ncbi:multidrug effflux MFS transporter [Actinopolymorpha sp. B9G3]|uniref:multidrug effflux MFS transporter n=1 Tax=Actinopolymorpha sp. B9G3 TaxID=3158970 RepID=UPI0032D9380A
MLLTVFGPISMDMYLPVLPQLTDQLRTSTSTAQLTMTACLVGLALGQIIAGPLSDRFGRRGPLLVGIAAYVLFSLACAISPSVTMLIIARLFQGAAGAVGIVIAQAAGRDLYDGGQLVRFYGRLAVIGGLAAIIGPVLGGQLAAITDWRGVFLALAGIGVIIFTVSLIIFGETLPVQRRHSGGLGSSVRSFQRLLLDRSFVGALLVGGFTGAALFAYLAGATFVLQDIYGLSPQEYSFAFGLNSLGFMLFGFLGGRIAEVSHWSERGAVAVGLTACAAGAGGLLITGLIQLPLIAFIVPLFVMVAGVAFASPALTAIALRDFPTMAGTAASFLGLTRYAFGGLAAPLVGAAGPHTATPLGIVTLTAAAAAALAFLTGIRTRKPTAPLPSTTTAPERTT